MPMVQVVLSRGILTTGRCDCDVARLRMRDLVLVKNTWRASQCVVGPSHVAFDHYAMASGECALMRPGDVMIYSELLP
jgi:hypothetical protein